MLTLLAHIPVEQRAKKFANAVDRFVASYAEHSEGCWLWAKTVNNRGYGVITVHYKHVLAHRFSHELYIGPIPEGHEVDHLCKSRPCVNPEHLEAVTRQVNVARSDWPAAVHARQTSCKKGHPFDEANTRRLLDGSRKCRTCSRETDRAYYARKRRRTTDRDGALVDPEVYESELP